MNFGVDKIIFLCAARDIYYAKYYGKGRGNGQLGKKIKNQELEIKKN